MDEEYEFLQYEDKGLSGYFSDRPDFQRMLHDVQNGKIKAIVCYKLDRVGRKTADLIRLMDFLEMYHVNLLICSNGINTASGLYKIFIQIFAVIAEFERDTLTERIVDNMMELAKDGRWLGGNTPMGFTVRRVTTGSGKGKSAYATIDRRHRRTSFDKPATAFPCSGRPRLHQKPQTRRQEISPCRVSWPLQ